ncbi:hypothetical protein HHK36_006290 [Tetracentron sinense]|uniref:non-specific serine/threonine protein kinase n=1 Tax=Tetracentron sinense TaxID=13715 RepID=A0A835DP26_TETSI|nr:hypothetical protein HHK36_006290 [Tetracentron sinense]
MTKMVSLFFRTQKREFGLCNPLGMAVIIWGLLLLVQLWTIFVTGSVTQSKICEADQITCLSTPDGVLFYINVELPGKAARKLLMETGTEESTINKFDQRTDLREEGRSFLLTPKTVAMAIPGMFLFSCILLCPCFRSRRKETANVVLAKDPISMDSASSLELSSASKKIPASPLPVPPSPQFSMFTKLSRLGLVHLNLSQVAKATHNFSPSLLVGEGGFGTVYKAQLQDGQIVAIKRTKTEHCEAQRTEFSNKIELLAKMEHRNLVKLHGYVDEGNEHIIITEFVPNGTLREHLDGKIISL